MTMHVVLESVSYERTKVLLVTPHGEKAHALAQSKSETEWEDVSYIVQEWGDEKLLHEYRIQGKYLRSWGS